ncbi:hypothetical protein D3C83_63400 [compost metagenome]
MPTTCMSRLGCPKNSAARHASARRASPTVTHGTAPSAAASSDTIAAAPAATACGTKAAPSVFIPRSATNTLPGSTRRES